MSTGSRPSAVQSPGSRTGGGRSAAAGRPPDAANPSSPDPRAGSHDRLGRSSAVWPVQTSAGGRRSGPPGRAPRGFGPGSTTTRSDRKAAPNRLAAAATIRPRLRTGRSRGRRGPRCVAPGGGGKHQQRQRVGATGDGAGQRYPVGNAHRTSRSSGVTRSVCPVEIDRRAGGGSTGRRSATRRAARGRCGRSGVGVADLSEHGRNSGASQARSTGGAPRSRRPR